jgi:prolyl 4-hydroxylase
MQVLHYVNGQKYEPHHDYFHDTVNPQKSNGGQRVATMLMYLTTVEEGGETVFPNSAEKVEGEQWSECARRGLAVKTQKGDALLFFRCVPHLYVSVKHWLSRLRKLMQSSGWISHLYVLCRH